ncbi:MAG: hypothetical protein ABIZ91_15805, partial [Gemmatimonadaceae bacterium]
MMRRLLSTAGYAAVVGMWMVGCATSYQSPPPPNAAGAMAAARAAGQAPGQKVYVTNQAGSTVSIIDVARLAVDTVLDLRTLGFTANAKPHHVVVEPDGSYWYLTLIGDGRVVKFDRNNRVVAQV